jgi:DNA-binding HxlR family transcriptional regulator
MNLTPRRPSDGPKGISTPLKGSALIVWTYLRSIAFMTSPPTRRFQVSRREIQRGTKIGSLNTIDEAVAALEAYGFILRFPEPGSNDGHQYELLTLDERPIPVVNVETITKTLRQLADNLEGSASLLKSDALIAKPVRHPSRLRQRTIG